MGKTGVKYTEDKVLAAIKGSGSIISTIAKRLQCNWHTAKSLTQTWDSTKQAMDDESEAVLDMAEGTLMKSMQGGDVQSSKWWLSTIGKRRGFTERTEITGEDGNAIELTYKVVRPNDKVDDSS